MKKIKRAPIGALLLLELIKVHFVTLSLRLNRLYFFVDIQQI